MTKAEVRKSKVYEMAIEKIRGYRKGFKFLIEYYTIPTPQRNVLKIVLHDACDMGLIRTIEFGLDIKGNCVDERFERV